MMTLMITIMISFLLKGCSFPRSIRLSPKSKLFSSSSVRNIKDTVDNESYYITTPIYYVNGLPHLGHAYTSITADVLARYNRLANKEVFFLTGTDEHGQKVEQSAAAANQTPIEFADKVSSTFRELTRVLDCSNDDFIRTTEDRHKKTVEMLWDQLLANDQIYLGRDQVVFTL